MWVPFWGQGSVGYRWPEEVILYEAAAVHLGASSNCPSSLICFCWLSFIIHAFCPFHNPKSNVVLPHVGLLMLLFNDCQDLWHLFVIYRLCEELILGNMHYIYSLIWFLCACEKPVINYRNLMERGTVALYKFPAGRSDKATAEEGCALKGRSVCDFSGRRRSRHTTQAQRHCLQCLGLLLEGGALCSVLASVCTLSSFCQSLCKPGLSPSPSVFHSGGAAPCC